jgi:predicted NAD/FAD-binding protein
MKLAIVGAGVAGLTAALRLQPRHDVTLFEADDRLGGHALTVDVGPEHERHAVDVGFMVFNDRNYPNFVRLLEELGIASRPTTMSFSVSDPRSGLEYNGGSLGTLFAQRRNLFNLRFLRMLCDVLRFNRDARLARTSPHGRETVGEYLERRRFSPALAREYLLPMGAAIWSCPAGTFARFPMRFVAEFFENHGLLDLVDRPQWRVIDGGSRTYVEAVARRLPGRIRLATPIVSVRRNEAGAFIQPRGAEPERFDHVVFACHSDQTLRILGADATATEREILSAFPYQRNTAVLHTDESLLPRSRRAWACWNVRLSDDDAAPAVTTYHLNQLQGIRSATNYCVTLNADGEIDPRRIVRTMQFDHPVFTTARDAAQARHGELLGANRTSYCGAYWRNGFHEDGVVSALAVVEALNAPQTSSTLIAAAPGERAPAEVAS